MRVVIGDDEILLRQGLASLLTAAGFVVVGMAGDAPGLLQLADRWRPDLLITDIRMPPGNRDDGLRAAMRVRAAHPGVAVLVLSRQVQGDALTLMDEDHRRLGYLLKQRVTGVEQFCANLRTIAAGGTVIDPEVVEAMLGQAATVKPEIKRLTPRQREVLALLAEGRSNAAIAARLMISERAVVQHTSKIYSQLDLWDDGNDHRRVLAVLRYLAR